MHCPRCGSDQFGGGSVCYNCGAKLQPREQKEGDNDRSAGGSVDRTAVAPGRPQAGYDDDTHTRSSAPTPASSAPSSVPPPRSQRIGSGYPDTRASNPGYGYGFGFGFGYGNDYAGGRGGARFRPKPRSWPKAGRPKSADRALILSIVSLFLTGVSVISILYGYFGISAIKRGKYLKGRERALAGIILSVVGFISSTIILYLMIKHSLAGFF